MTMHASVVLKVALWFQAALLLVLTSILADTDAWVGAIVTGVGLAFVVVGIISAHKQHIGCLYFYATLVGVWEILALAHILMICGLVALPRVSHIDLTAAVIGKRTAENKNDPLRIVLPVLYGLHWSLWCLALVCLVSLRLVAQDPTSGFEIQDPKEQQQQQQQRPHSIESARSLHRQQYRTSFEGVGHNSGGHRQHLLNFRQSVISPIGGPVATAVTPTASYPYTYQGKKSVPTRFSTDSKTVRMPDRSYQGMSQRRASSESNAIYIPNDPRISQVVVTFKNEPTDLLSSGRTVNDPLQVSKRTPESTTVFITNHNYALGGSDRDGAGKSNRNDGSLPGTAGSKMGNVNDAYVLNFASSGESLSDMIFKQAHTTGGQYQFGSTSNYLPELSSAVSASVSAPTTSATPTSVILPPLPETMPSGYSGHQYTESIVKQVLDDNYNPNPARIRATETKASLTLSSDSSSSALSSISCSTTTSLGNDPTSLSQEGVIAGLTMASVTPLNVISKDKKKEKILQDDPSSDDGYLFEQGSQNASFPANDGDSSASEVPQDSSPGTQPNSSDSSHSLSSILSSSSLPRRDESSPDHPTFIAQGTPSAPTYVSPPLPLSSSSSTFTTPASSPNEPRPVMSSSAHSFSHTTPAVVATHTSPRSGSSPAKSKPSLASIPFQYWRNRAAAATSSTPASPPPSLSSSSSHRRGTDSPPASSIASSSSFSQSYLGQTASLFSKKKKFQIPTIVIHPDEEDGEAPRVLSQKDIEYLSTMPPAPLRLLIQPWEEEYTEDGGEYDDGVNEGYDYDESFHPHHSTGMQETNVGYHQQGLVLDSVQEEENEEEYADPMYEEDGELAEVDRYDDLELDHIHPHHNRRRNAFGGHGGSTADSVDCDPYALDVPIDLDVDLQSLHQIHQQTNQGSYHFNRSSS